MEFSNFCYLPFNLPPAKQELAVMVARGSTGAVEAYPVLETVHCDSICWVTEAPPQGIPAATAEAAQQLALRAVEALQGGFTHAGLAAGRTRTHAQLLCSKAPVRVRGLPQGLRQNADVSGPSRSHVWTDSSAARRRAKGVSHRTELEIGVSISHTCQARAGSQHLRFLGALVSLLQRHMAGITEPCLNRQTPEVAGVGVFGVELFLTAEGELLLNEVAPRPHNSGELSCSTLCQAHTSFHTQKSAHVPALICLCSLPWATSATLPCGLQACLWGVAGQAERLPPHAEGPRTMWIGTGTGVPALAAFPSARLQSTSQPSVVRSRLSVHWVSSAGHYTIEGCRTSQYEQHLRAILGWPLGLAELKAGFGVLAAHSILPVPSDV